MFLKAKEKAFRFLGFKARTEKELTDKLRKEEIPQDIIPDVIELMKRYDYINDERYAREYAAERVRLKGHGRRRIEYELKNKGVNAEYIDNAMEHLESGGYDGVNEALCKLEKKCRAPLDELDFKERNRLYNYLVRQGYDFNVIDAAFARAEGRT